MGKDLNSKARANSARSQFQWVNTAIRKGAGSSSCFLEADNGTIEELVNDAFGVENLTTWFLPGCQRAVELFMLTSTRVKASTFCLPRDKVLPSEQLRRQLFPFVEKIPSRRIILQDFAVMMVAEDASSGGAGSNGERHMSFVREIAVQYPVLSSPAFLEFATSLRKSMASGSAQSNPVPIESSTPMDEDVLRLVAQQ
ncbi:hypothetical protein BGZ97_007386 [Linnemannia gamsii]|uniref:Uncharacterized protein n=1 Tax=Linnemannia gamsii TaxID=64522 RepID=A0A9P6UE44_9FUNG|nr:hypothetical protein BGZ97_007386 [Linnemannia gamsii]